MPTYSFSCEDCSHIFEIFCSYNEYTDKQKCPECRSKKTNRLYSLDLASMSSSIKKSDSELKTIGDLARRNSERMSEDQKTELYSKHNSYKDVTNDKPLPKGMSRIPKQPKIQWPK